MAIPVGHVGSSHCGSRTKWRQREFVSGVFSHDYFQNHFHITFAPTHSHFIPLVFPVSSPFPSSCLLSPVSIYFFLLNHTTVEPGTTSSSKMLHKKYSWTFLKLYDFVLSEARISYSESTEL